MNLAAAAAKSITGIRTALGHIASGGALGLFPTGEVSTWQKKDRRTALGPSALRRAQEPIKGRVIEDKPWPENIIKLIKNSGLPVVPIYFDGTNTTFFHLLGKIHPRLRTVRLVRELACKNGTLVKVRIGKAIPAAEVANMDIPTLREYLRNRTYALESQCVPQGKEASVTKMAPVAAPVDPRIVKEQMERLEDKIVLQTGDYRGYVIAASDAPDAMRAL